MLFYARLVRIEESGGRLQKPDWVDNDEKHYPVMERWEQRNGKSELFVGRKYFGKVAAKDEQNIQCCN